MLRMENIAGRRIVDDDGFVEVSSDLAQIFHIVALMVVTALSKQSVMHGVVNIQLIKQRVAVLRHRSCKDNNLVQLANSFEECINARSFYDIDVVILSFNFDWYLEIGLVENLSKC